MRTNEAVWLDKYGRWQIKVQKEGIRRTFTSPKEGRKGKIECEKKADVWLNNGMINTSIRFGEAWALFLEEKKELTGTASYKQLESLGRNWILTEIEHRKLEAVTPAHLQAIINKAFKAGKSKTTLEALRGALSKFHKYCKKQRWSFCGVELVEICRGAKVKQKQILQPEQIQAIFNDDTDEFYIHAFRFLILTGLRRGELCGLMNADIDGSVAYIKRSFNHYGEMSDGKTENAQRAVALCQRAIEVLQAQREMLKSRGIISPYVFPNKHGGISNTNHLYNYWRSYSKALGINCSLHELRHTLISYASANVPEALLKKTVGHSKSMKTGIYIHTVNDESTRVAALLDERFRDII